MSWCNSTAVENSCWMTEWCHSPAVENSCWIMLWIPQYHWSKPSLPRNILLRQVDRASGMLQRLLVTFGTTGNQNASSQLLLPKNQSFQIIWFHIISAKVFWMVVQFRRKEDPQAYNTNSGSWVPVRMCNRILLWPPREYIVFRCKNTFYQEVPEWVSTFCVCKPVDSPPATCRPMQVADTILPSEF